MISSGLATIYVSDMDRAVEFYSGVLGLKLAYRFGNDWAQIIAGQGLTIGLHPASDQSPAGKKGSITIGLNVSKPLEEVVKELKEKGAKINGEIVNDEAVKVQYIEDPDGNEIYLAEVNAQYSQFIDGDWKKETA
ncbi:MAG TPA: VOC family protein [Blastocatellia bacterium]|nr:VOC family protein [Blastocatellia bacterium]